MATKYAKHVKAPDVLMPTIVLYEVYKALKQRMGRAQLLPAVAQMADRQAIPLEANLALAAAEVSIAHSLPMADAIIYATAQQHEAKLITSDAHFEGLPGVEYVAATEGQ